MTMPPLAEPLDMVTVHGGTFRMGSPEADPEAYENEKPQHTVTVSAFCISRYLVTRQLYREILGQAPATWGEDTDDERFPANEVSWFDAVAFCNALSAHVGLQPCYHITGQHVEWDTSADGYRLPTEAEWEYACRAGTTSAWFFGDDPTALGRYAWFTGNSGDRVHPIGEKEANPWGLHDMIGNVWEWCWDCYNTYLTGVVCDPPGPKDGICRTRRGGSAWIDPCDLRSACRDWDKPEFQFCDFGFRCVRRPRH